MVSARKLVHYCDELLDSALYRDYCPNGLQVQGAEEITQLVTGVTASEALIDAAIAQNADAILVHHGYFWKGESQVITGMKYQRLRKLLNHGINLIVYHLPLDGHAQFGNNVQLAGVLDISVDDRFDLADGSPLGFMTHFAEPQAGMVFKDHITTALRREPLYIPGTSQPIKKLAWCTGGAQDAIEIAHEQGADGFLTGEVSERTVHFARENQMHFFAAGHHATERYGVKALGEHLGEQFNLEHTFIDIDNPV